MILKRFLIPILIGVATSFAQTFASSTIHVSTQGDDTANGTEEYPLRTIEAAQRLAQQLRSKEKEQSITIQLAKGVYELSDTLRFTQNDSGIEEYPLEIRGPGRDEDGRLGAIITGGRQLYGFEPVVDPKVLARIPEEAHGKVLQTNLKDHGIEDWGSFQRRGFALNGPGSLKLYYEGDPMTVARWPNEEWAVTTALFGNISDEQRERGTGVQVSPQRLSKWKEAENVWAHGYWYHGWADEHASIESIDSASQIITFTHRHRYGYRDDRHFYVYNLIEELDQPGEWYLDNETGNLFFWPPEPVPHELVSATVTVLDTPIIQFNNASNIRISNIGISYGRSHAIVIRNGRNVKVLNCSISNVDRTAISIQNGYGHSVENSHLFNLNESGIRIQGGDRSSLKPGNHEASNNHIHDYAQWTRTYRGAIELVGVGNKASHNLIHDAPHVAIRFSGNEHLINNNEIFRVVTESDDAGAIYSGRDWSARGTRIENNFIYMSGITFREFHAPENHMPLSRHFHSSALIYLDDLLSGITIQGNILQGIDATIKIGGGRDNIVRENIVAGGDRGVRLDARGLAWAKPHVAPGGRFRMWERLQEVNFDSPPYSEAYPELVTLPDNQPNAPLGNRIENNVFIGVKHPLYFLHGSEEYVSHAGNQSIDTEDYKPAALKREELKALILSSEIDETLSIDLDFNRFGPSKTIGE